MGQSADIKESAKYAQIETKDREFDEDHGYRPDDFGGKIGLENDEQEPCPTF